MPAPTSWLAFLHLFAGSFTAPGYGAYARWVREGRWSPDELWRCLVVQLVEHWVPEGRLALLLDDTLVNKSGRKVDGAGFFHDAVTSTAVAHKVSAWGLNVVVLALRVPSPWGSGGRWTRPSAPATGSR